jgi:cell division protein FtsQ
MARRQTAQLDLELPEELAEVRAAAPAPPARRPASVAAPRGAAGIRWRWSVVAVVAALAIGAGSFLLYRVDQVLASDSRFLLGAAGLEIHGVVHAPRERVRAVFVADLGRSIYLMPLEDRRRSLLALDWVREARLSRHWPNRVRVEIVERTPAAFLLAPSAGGRPAHLALIDAEGVILEPPARAEFTFPVLRGVAEEAPLAVRRERVALLLRLLAEAPPAVGQISEVDLSDPDSLKVTALVEGLPVRLLLAPQDFRRRLENLLSHYGEIRRRFPQARAFDLRLEGRITVLEVGDGG